MSPLFIVLYTCSTIIGISLAFRVAANLQARRERKTLDQSFFRQWVYYERDKLLTEEQLRIFNERQSEETVRLVYGEPVRWDRISAPKIIAEFPNGTPVDEIRWVNKQKLVYRRGVGFIGRKVAFLEPGTLDFLGEKIIPYGG
jgi:hypothetical protein